MVHGNSCCKSIFNLGDSTPQPLVVLFRAPEFRDRVDRFCSGTEYSWHIFHQDLVLNYEMVQIVLFLLFWICLLFKGHQVGRNLKTKIWMTEEFTSGSSYLHSTISQTRHLLKCTSFCLQKRGEGMQLSSSSKNILRAAENPGIIKILNCCKVYNFIIWLQNFLILRTFVSKTTLTW